MKVWVYEPGRDDWVEGVYLTLEAALRDIDWLREGGYEVVEETTEDGEAFRSVKSLKNPHWYGALIEWEVQE